MANSLVGQRFNVRHAAGVTRYQVDRAHRNYGYYECVAIRGVEGTHHFVGSVQVMSGSVIREALETEADPYDARESFDRIRRTRATDDLPHAFTADAGEPSRVKYGEEDIDHCAICGQAKDRPVHREAQL